MAWYYGTYSCGHEGRTNIVGPEKNRQQKADWIFSRLCPECHKKEKQAELERQMIDAEEKSKKMDLPALTGTEKQIAWANTLRVKIIEKIENNIAKVEESKLSNFPFCRRDGSKEIMSTTKGEMMCALDYAVKKYTEARFWIDNRDNFKLFSDFFEEYRDSVSEAIITEDIKREMQDHDEIATARPDSGSLKNGVVKIKYCNNSLIAEYVKDSEFMSFVKKLGYRWNGSSWAKRITEYTGSAEDRAAELGNTLLGGGFTVQFPNAGIKECAVSGNYIPENDRWIKFFDQKLVITWSQRNDTLYNAAKKLPGARWRDGSMRVDLEFYREVEDFAETMGFSISRMACSKIEEYRQLESEFDSVRIASVTKKYSDDERIADLLKSKGTIIEDLKDE